MALSGPSGRPRDIKTEHLLCSLLRTARNVDGCLITTGIRTSAGYARAHCRDQEQRGLSQLAHRLLMAFLFGPPPSNKPHVRHTCGNGQLGCMNIEHLEWASPKDNSADAVRHGKMKGGRVLNPVQVQMIRRLAICWKANRRGLAKSFGVSQPTISNVIAGRSYPKLPMMRNPSKKEVIF